MRRRGSPLRRDGDGVWRRLRRHPWLLTALVIEVALVMVPLAYMISTSFKLPAEVFEVPMRWIPRELHFSNYIAPLQERPFVRWFVNSMVVAVTVTFLNILTSVLAGYSFAK
ncbi:MAG: hypothetical protein R6U87_00765, partial [Thiohalospira sp.]